MSTLWPDDAVRIALCSALGPERTPADIRPEAIPPWRGFLEHMRLAPGDAAVPRVLRQFIYTLGTEVTPKLEHRLIRDFMGLSEKDVEARRSVSRRPRAPDDVRACVMPWVFAQDAGVVDWISMVRQDEAPAIGGSTVTAEFCIAWEKAKQVFRISPAFADMLARTETAGVRAADFALPYDTFYVAVPGCTQQHPDVVGGGTLAISGIGVRVEDRGVLTRKGDLIPGPSLQLLIWCAAPESAGGVLDDAYQIASMPLGAFYTDSPEAAILRLSLDEDDLMGEARTIPPGIRWAIRVVVNLVLYINSDGAEMRPAPEAVSWATKRKIAEGKKNPMKKARALRGVPDFVLTDLAPSIHGDGDGEPSGRHPRRHWVRGHWRRQPVGPRGEGARSLRWVRPHLRGGEEGDTTPPRIYVGPEAST